MPGALQFWTIGQLAAIYYWFPKPIMVSTDVATHGRLPEPDVMVNKNYLNGIELIG
jgi:hypothetical protein